ncbi:hypothetical protein [Pandoraea sp. PE-S2T-3]|uniref:hypothetical protein n=1 Tax=Pandoraea sp. PE-S2T-3 TaxID=1986993 RepID=UPI000B3F87CB|nr:hypothetical protein [Pandoraea sp. PE-S2T-3]
MGAALLMAACPPGVAARARHPRGASPMARSTGATGVTNATDALTGVHNEVVTTATPRTAGASPSLVRSTSRVAMLQGIDDVTAIPTGPASAPPASPASAQHTDIDSASPAASSAPALDGDWLAGSDLSTFLDGPSFTDFVAMFGNGTPPGETRASFLNALYQALDPQDLPGVSPWDASNFKRTATDALGNEVRAIDALLQRIGLSLGYGTAPAAYADPTFAQGMLARLLHTMIFPGMNDANDQIPASLRTQWLTWLRPDAFNAACAGEDTGHFERAGNADRWLARLGDTVFADEGADLAQAKSWAYRLLGALFDPILAVDANAAPVRVGSLPWALQRIGMRVTGLSAWQSSAPEWVTTAATAYLTALELGPEAITAFFHSNADIVLLFAHASGTVDLRDDKALAAAALQDAMDLFHVQMAESFSNDHAEWIDALRGELPSRAAILTRALSDRLPEVESVYFTVAPVPKYFETTHFGRLITVALAFYKTLRGDCIRQDEFSAMEDLILDGCMDDIHRIAPALGARLRDAGLDTQGVNQRFDAEFTASVAHIRDVILQPALEALVSGLASEAFRYWTCGTWQMRVPTVRLLVPDESSNAHTCASCAGGFSEGQFADTEATHTVFIDTTLDGAANHFVVTLAPLRIERFDGDADAWMHAFARKLVGTQGDEPPLRARNDVASYRMIKPAAGNLHESPTRALAAEFSARLEAFRTAAYDKTPIELHRESVHRLLLGFVPFHDCADDVQTGSYRRALVDCGIDVVGAIPLAYAAMTAQKATWQASRLLLQAAIDDLSHGVARRAGLRGAARLVPHLLAEPAVLAAVDLTNFRLSQTGLAAVRFVDPGFELATRATLHLPDFARRLRDKLRAVKVAPSTVNAWTREADAAVTYVHHAGVWQVPHGQTGAFHAARPIVAADGGQLDLVDWDAHTGAVVKRDGAWLRLANPHSGKTYGPAFLTNAHSKIIAPTPVTLRTRHAPRAPAPESSDLLPTGAPDACPAPETFGELRKRRAVTRGTIPCAILSRQQGAKSAVITPLFQQPPPLRHFDTKTEQWRDVDANDVAARIGEVAWPIPDTFDEYYLKGNRVFWCPTTRGAKQNYLLAGVLHLPPVLTGVVYPEHGYVRIDVSIDLDTLAEPLHFERRRALYASRALGQGNRAAEPGPGTSRGRTKSPEGAFTMKVALPYAETVAQGNEQPAVVLLGADAYGFLMHRTRGRTQRPYPVSFAPLTPDAQQNFHTFQAALHSDLNARWVGETQMLGSLRDLDSPGLEAQFDRIFGRAESLLVEARTALGGQLAPMVICLLDRFVPGRAHELAAALSPVLAKMHEGLQVARRERDTVMGVMENISGAVAETLYGTLGHPEYASNLQRPVIGFDTSALASMPDEMLAAVLLHEISHATVASSDALSDGRDIYAGVVPAPRTQRELPTMVPAPSGEGDDNRFPPDIMDRSDTPRYHLIVRDYLVNDGLRVDIGQMLNQQGDNAIRDIVQHADSLEHLILTIAYAHDPAQHGRIGGLLRRETSVYQRYTPTHTPWAHRTSPGT